MWGLNIKHKIKHFIWNCLKNILPTNEAVSRRIRKGGSERKCCGCEVETIEYMLFFFVIMYSLHGKYFQSSGKAFRRREGISGNGGTNCSSPRKELTE